jgi:hypothetical protein
MAKHSTTLGSQKLLQRAVNRRPALLRNALRKAGALNRGEDVRWASPLATDAFKEYRDHAALNKLGLSGRLSVALADFWPARGAVWDALGLVPGGSAILVEAKAHIPEAASPGTQAAGASKEFIEQSLAKARKIYAPKSRANWSGTFYQYANRLAHQDFLRRVNGLDTKLVFLAFTNAAEVDGPATEAEWHGATRLLHAVLGLPADLTRFGVHHAFIDARLLADAS